MADQDLAALWDEHCRSEFDTRDVSATMATMVDAPYVNHVPTMTGGVGRDQLKRFYKYHFIGANPDDTRLIPISRTVGANSLVDEMLFCFTHTREIDWMLPGIPPTGRSVEIPLVAIVQKTLCGWTAAGFRRLRSLSTHIRGDPCRAPLVGPIRSKLLPILIGRCWLCHSS